MPVSLHLRSLLLILFLFSFVISIAQNSFSISADAQLRTGPGVKFKSMYVVKAGEKVKMIDSFNRAWMQVDYQGRGGFIARKLLIPVADSIVATTPVIVTAPIQKQSALSTLTILCIIAGVLLISLLLIPRRKRPAMNARTKADALVTNNQISSPKVQSNAQTPAAFNNNVSQLKPVQPAMVSSTLKKTVFPDDVVEVTPEKFNTSIPTPKNRVPVLLTSDIAQDYSLARASEKQKQFFQDFKTTFLLGSFVDVEGNENYLTVLLNDLVKDYDFHGNIIFLRAQLRQIDLWYPFMKQYTAAVLEKMMRAQAIVRREGIPQQPKVIPTLELSGDPYAPTPLGTKYKDQLQLSNTEVKLLNELDPWTNSFTAIEYCLVSTAKLYLAIFKHLTEDLRKRKSGLDLEIKRLKAVLFPNYSETQDGGMYHGSIDYMKHRVCIFLFKHCENKIREIYGHKRKVNVDGPFFNAVADELFNESILSPVSIALNAMQSSVVMPDAATELELNTQNTLRWKTGFEQITKEYKTDAAGFSKAIQNLAQRNQKNPSVENIFYEASKFVASTDRTISLQMYLRYIDADLRSDKIDNKQLNRTLQKSLFQSSGELEAFEQIVNKLISHKDLDAAINEAALLQQLKKKKIVIDKSAIAAVEQQHSGTVAILNVYLKDEAEEEVQLTIETPPENIALSIYKPELPFQTKNIATLNYFVKNNFSVDQKEFEIFAKTSGSFKSQLIDNLNETCFELLDDNLIEEEDDLYIMNSEYYQTLLQP